MINQMLEVFRNKCATEIDNLIIDNYVPYDGTYIIVEPNEAGVLDITSITEIEKDRKTKDIDRTLDRILLLSKLDYYSKLIKMNKPIASKTIHSNNYLSFFVKKESLQGGKVSEEIIDEYYYVLSNPLNKYIKKRNSRELYLAVEEEIGSVDLEKLYKVKSWIKENLNDLNIDYNKKNYLKIFFLWDEEDFIREGKRYLIPNIYNNNDYNYNTSLGLLGVPSNNMVLNSKKPYLENKTRKCKLPYLVKLEDALMEQKIFDYLSSQYSRGFCNVYIGDDIKVLKNGELLDENLSGFYMRLKGGIEMTIVDFDVISEYRPNLKRPFKYENILGVDYSILYKNVKDNFSEYGTKYTLKEIMYLLNNVLFDGSLINNFFSEVISAKNNDLIMSINMARNKLFAWFYKGCDSSLWSVLDKVTRLQIKNSLSNGYGIKVMNQFNLMYSLKDYFLGGENHMMATIANIKEELRNGIFSKSDYEIKSADVYFYAVGQLTSYLLSKSNSKSKPLSLINPILNANKDDLIKKHVMILFKKYNFKLDTNINVRFKNLYSMVLGYKPEGKINKDLIIAGYINNNLIYEKIGD